MSNKFMMVALIIGIAIIGIILGIGLLREHGTTLDESGIQKFASVADLRDYLKEHEQTYSDMGMYGPVPVMNEVMRDSGMQAPLEKAGISIPGAGSAQDYSTTNVQVEGVDEADFLKNDGKYIYILSGDTIVIVDAYPAEKAKIVSETHVRGQPVEMFVRGDRLVVFTTLQDEVMVKPESSVVPVPYWRPVTHAYIYSIKDREDPDLVQDVNVSGSYYDSRMIGDMVYLITSESVQWIGNDPIVPMAESDGKLIAPDIYYFDMPQRYFVYHTLASFNIKGDDVIQAKTFLLGYATTLYASTESIFIAYQKEIPYVRWVDIAPGVRNVPVDEAEYRQGTIIHRFGIDDGDIRYEGLGEVPGHLLNQFSMDESGGNLRVATTVEGWGSKGSFMFNNVYVLDSDMKTIGKLENIAPDERIYSTRFIGDRLYMVTFKRIDPFFVIDLSDPKNPAILGKLKIPGFSDYLHPYDQNHIIGIGKETEENQWGGVSIAGVKIALFDVSDVNNPTLIDKVEIGEAGTDSEALRDHKAFLFDKEKNLLVIPIREVQKVYVQKMPYESYTQKVWQGAYVFGVDKDKGFTIRGKVTHSADEGPYYYWDSPSSVRRSLYMDDVLYTVSSRSIIMSDLKDLKEQLNEVKLPYEGYGGVYPMPMKAVPLE